MRILAIDTSTSRCLVALVDNGRYFQRVRDIPREHTQYILPFVDELLKEADLSLRDLNAVAYGQGPGSFTGLRIALSMAQGLAYAANLPLIGVSSLSALAQTAIDTNIVAVGETLICCLDARRSEVYWAAYTISETGAEPISQEQVTAPEVKAINDYLLHNPVIVGSGLPVFAEEQREKASRCIADLEVMPRSFLRLAEIQFDSGEAKLPEDAPMVYLRNDVTW